jgi:hypothetical protein
MSRADLDMTNTVSRPALRYFGSKWRLAPWIIEHFAPHDVYVEPFAGGAGVLLRKPPSALEVYNDLDGEVVNFFNVLRNETDELIRRLDLTPFAREAWENAYEPTEDPIEEARLIGEMVDAGRDAAQIAERFGKSPSWVSNRKRLTTLPVYVQEHVHDGKISVRQAQPLATAFAVEEEHPELVEQVNVDLRPGTLAGKAMRGHLTSDDIRDRTDELIDVVERVEESKQDHKQDSDSTTETDEPRQNRTEASASDGGCDAGARASKDLRSDDQNGPERASSEDSASRPSVDEEEHQESKGAVTHVVLVACSKSKLNTPAHAQALYKGQLFEKSKAYAKQLVEDGEADAWYILSAKHGLVEPREMIDPYDETLTDASVEEKREWGQQIILQLKDVAPTMYTPVTHIILGGKDYYKPIRSFWEDVHEVRRRTFMAPFEGMAGNGEMMQWLDERLEKEDSAAFDAEMSGDGAPSSDSSTGHPAHLPMVIDAVETDGHDWKLQSLDDGQYQGTVQNGGTAHMAEGATPADALQSAWHSAQDLPADEIGSVDEPEVDRLLSAEGTEMWDDQAAEEASIASLLVAHRVAGERQETWRTTLIAEAVEERVGRVDRDDVPEDVLEEVQAEVERRLEPVEA